MESDKAPIRRRYQRRRLVALAALALLLVGVAWLLDRRDDSPAGAVNAASQASPGSSTSTSSPSSTASSAPTTTGPVTNLDAVSAQLQPVVSVTHPTGVAQRPGTEDLYATGREGPFVKAPRTGGATTIVHDFSSEISISGESGVLDLAFSGDGALVYLSLVRPNGDLTVVEFPFDGDRLAVERARTLVAIPSPGNVHHAGDVDIDLQGLLWLSVGDGGPSQGLNQRAQDLQDLRGKILRIDPRPTGTEAYGIPPDNPFVGRADARPEIWAYGLRNPWRFDVDPATGDLWIGDVGRNGPEEIDFDPAPRAGAGVNFGWPFFEGDAERSEGAPDGLVPPLLVYGHGDACSVTGGSVYHGKAIAGLAGAYVYADLCDGFVRALSLENGAVKQQRTFDNLHSGSPTCFGLDSTGELYLCSYDEDSVYLLAPA